MKTTKPHVHAEIIRAWADNPAIEIEYREIGLTKWVSIDTVPLWCADCEYRIKPEKVYPETRMSGDELMDIYITTTGEDNHDFIAIANAAIRHAVDSGQLVVPEAEK